MTMFDVEGSPDQRQREPIPTSDIDMALAAQLVVAWAGEKGEDARLGWWQSNLVSEYGGEDLFHRLLPNTWRWAGLQGAREAARRTDMEARRRDHAPDRIVSLFSLSFELDERIEERIEDLKRSGRAPGEALPGLAIVGEGWNRGRFWEWVDGHGRAEATASPIGRRLTGTSPLAVAPLVRKLVAGLAPDTSAYPIPHFTKAQ
jgi:hypothetical protein